MIWKLIVKILGCKKKDYAKHIKMGKNVFIVSIRKYVSVEEMMKIAANCGVFAAEQSKMAGD